ncbi:MAG: hypothetical protein R2715_22145 [Ilumatobacteraceae bacterium]
MAVSTLTVLAVSGAGASADAAMQATEDLPDIVASLESAPVIGGWLSSHDASVWVADQMNDLPTRLGSAGDSGQWLQFSAIAWPMCSGPDSSPSHSCSMDPRLIGTRPVGGECPLGIVVRRPGSSG